MNFLTQQRWQAFKSTETELTIPPFAPVQLGSRTDRTRMEIDSQTGEYFLLAGQCWDIVQDLDLPEGRAQYVSCDDVGFNGPLEVPPGGRGFLTLDAPCVARFTGDTDGLLTPATQAVGGDGWELQNVLPTATLNTIVPSCFRRLGFLNVGGRLNIVILRIRFSQPVARTHG